MLCRVAGALMLILIYAVSGAKKDCRAGEYWRSVVGRCESCTPACSEGSSRFCPTDCRTPPTIKNITGTADLTEGDSLSLTCFPTGRPYPQISWSLNSRDLSKKNNISTFGNTIQIKGIRTSDAGDYTCTAINDQGKASLTREVTVREKCKEGHYFEGAIKLCIHCRDVEFCHQRKSSKCPKECNGWQNANSPKPDNYNKKDETQKFEEINKANDKKGSSNPDLGTSLGPGIAVPIVLILAVVLIVLLVRKYGLCEKKKDNDYKKDGTEKELQNLEGGLDGADDGDMGNEGNDDNHGNGQAQNVEGNQDNHLEIDDVIIHHGVNGNQDMGNEGIDDNHGNGQAQNVEGNQDNHLEINVIIHGVNGNQGDREIPNRNLADLDENPGGNQQDHLENPGGNQQGLQENPGGNQQDLENPSGNQEGCQANVDENQGDCQASPDVGQRTQSVSIRPNSPCPEVDFYPQVGQSMMGSGSVRAEPHPVQESNGCETGTGENCVLGSGMFTRDSAICL